MAESGDDAVQPYVTHSDFIHGYIDYRLHRAGFHSLQPQEN